MAMSIKKNAILNVIRKSKYTQVKSQQRGHRTVYTLQVRESFGTGPRELRQEKFKRKRNGKKD